VSALFILHPTLLGVKRAPRLLAVSLVSVLLMVAVEAGDALDLLPDEYRNSLANRNTLNWRFAIWTEALAVYFRSDFWSQVFGRPIGEPLVLQIEQGEWRYSVHGTHVGFLLSYGILGSFLWVTLLLAALFGALRRRHHVLQMGDLEPAVAVCWLLILLIYGYSYEWGNGAGVFLAMAMLPLIRCSSTYAGGGPN
jgi:O-antigen ligase